MSIDKKVLMIATQEIVSDQSDGGKKGSNRNWRMLKDIFGVQNITLIMYTNNAEDSRTGVIRLAYSSYRREGNRGVSI